MKEYREMILEYRLNDNLFCYKLNRFGKFFIDYYPRRDESLFCYKKVSGIYLRKFGRIDFHKNFLSGFV